MQFSLFSTPGLMACVVAVAAISGCKPTTTQTDPDPTKLSANSLSPNQNASSNETLPQIEVDTDTEHGHSPGTHGGILISLGRDSYHVEAVIDSAGIIRLYTLGQDESRVIDVETQHLQGFAKAIGDTESVAITFEPTPQDGDSRGKTSLFTGQLPNELMSRQLTITIPNILIDGERFRLGFSTESQAHGESPEMPDKVADGQEKDLYLTPSGRYTADDIAANGNVTASQKFKGIRSSHDMSPKTGDQICPITQTKANPKFTWVIDGKPYQFCCPPCVDEFLKMAKESSEPLPEPESFVKQ